METWDTESKGVMEGLALAALAAASLVLAKMSAYLAEGASDAITELIRTLRSLESSLHCTECLKIRLRSR